MTEGFEPLRGAIGRVFPKFQLDQLGEAAIASLRSQYPGVPEHYLEFLRHIGWGSLGDNFMIYSGLVEPDEIFDPQIAASLAGIVFIGDDFAGWMLGFDTSNKWRLVGVDSSSLKACPEAVSTVADFFAQRIAEYESA